MQSCDSKCGQCARDFWKWLKSREHQMNMPWAGSGTSFAEAAARRPTALEPGVTMQYRGQTATVLADSGFTGLDGRHWVKVAVGTWEVHVYREELT